jgi:hypothetical protein
MNVNTIQEYPPIARIHFREYRKKVRAHRAARLAEAKQKVLETGQALRYARRDKSLIEQEDEVLMRSYEEMAKGARLINLQSVLQGAGLNSKHLPNLAIARADWKEVWLTWHNGGSWSHPDSFVFHENRWEPNWNKKDSVFSNGIPALPIKTFGAELQNQEWRQNNHYPVLPVHALVPAVPAHLRPDGNLDKYHILFEANWQAKAPPDPILLRHVAGVIYSVVAQWDLTSIEKSVLEGRIT